MKPPKHTLTIPKTMKTALITYAFTLMCLVSANTAQANNIQVSNTTLVDNTGTTAKVQFDISWENSWRGGGVANWDAAWVFVKYKLANGQWYHVKLSGSGHTSPAGTLLEPGLLTPGTAFNATSNPNLGMFLRRDADGSGTFTASGAQLLWDYSAQGIFAFNDIIAIQVFAIEMAYVNQAAFEMGASGLGKVYTYPTGTSTYAVTSEAAINVGTTDGYLYYAEGSGQSGDRGGPIPAAFPKGFAAFYCMKYEVSQQGYVDFLNTLNYARQVTRTATAPSSAAGTGALSSSNADRNGIDISTPGADPVPAVYACNLNGNGVYGEADDGKDIACNHLSISDLWAYLDWSGLRPMTELEFEKACRGPQAPFVNEYPWGSGVALAGYTLADAGTANEGIASDYSLTTGNAAWQNTTVNFDGPVRVGAFAANVGNTGRITSGSSYFGIMELAGNVNERAITIGDPSGRAYTGTHGNGELAIDGNADPTTWATAITATGYRGGGWDDYTASRMLTSDRSLVNYSRLDRYVASGGRGVRTAP